MRIFVTGIGVMSPLARGAQATMDAVLAGQCAIKPLSLFELADSRAQIAAQVPALGVAEVAGGSAEGWSRSDALALLAAREAIAHAALQSIEDIWLIVATTTSGMFESEKLLFELTADPARPSPGEQLRCHPLSAPADRVHQRLGPFAQVHSLCSACSGGATAILMGAAAIASGQTERVLAGGTDALCRLTYAGFSALSALDPRPCRPFDRTRAGLSLGEAAAFLVLESETAMRARAGRPIAELRGWAMAAEAHHITHPEPDGGTAARVMAAALGRAGLTVQQLDYINAHGTATPHNDEMEAAAIMKLLGEQTGRVMVSSTKGHIGHTLAAAGALEAAITVMAIERSMVPPTVGLTEPDPACPLNHVMRATPKRLRAALSNAFGFGGTDTVLVFADPELAKDPEPRQASPKLVITAAATLSAAGLLTGADSLVLLHGEQPLAARLELPQGKLALDRIRRMGRSAKMATMLTMAALEAREERASRQGDDASSIGLVVGSVSGCVAACGQLLTRLFERGARYVSPILFPSVLPSALSSAGSIYLGMRGPVFTVADLSASGEAAFFHAVSLLLAGETERMTVAAVEEHSAVIDHYAGPICMGLPPGAQRSEGGAAMLVESAESAQGRGVRPLARLVWLEQWRGEVSETVAVPPPKGRAVVYCARPSAARLQPLFGPWQHIACQVLSARLGHHEAAGAMALALAAASLDSGEVDSVLVLGAAPDRGYAVLLQTVDRLMEASAP